MRNAEQTPPASGVYTALATPRCPDKVEADAASLLDYLDAIVQAGVDGIVLFGSTGEFVHFDITERKRVLGLVIKRSRVPLLVNVSHSTFTGALDLAENAIQLGASGLLLMPPYFFRYSEEELFEFYRQFADVIDARARIYLYSIPQFTNPISDHLLERLLSAGYFAGIKDSSGDWQFFEVMLRLHARLRFQLLAGNEALYRRAMQAGANGIVSGVAAAVPELLVALNNALSRHDTGHVQLLDRRLHEFLIELNKFPSSVAIKQAAFARGWKLNHFAVPPDDDAAAALDRFQGWFRNWLPAVLAECSTASVGSVP